MKIFKVYRKRKVLITGHTGFVGSWLALWLHKLGAEVIGYSLPPLTNPNHYELLNLKIKNISGDVLNFNSLKQVFQKHKPEIVFHLAAQPLVRRSYLEPAYTFAVNVQGTVNLLEAVRETKDFVKAVVIITSDKCYENKGYVWGYREFDPLGGKDPYSASKACAELVTASYRNSFFPPEEYGKTHTTLIATARAGNIIGGGDWGEDRLIPDIIKAVAKNKKVKIRNPQAVRPWQYILDVLQGYLLLGAKLYLGEKDLASAWNFGPVDFRAYKVIEVLEKIKMFWPELDFEILPEESSLREASYLRLDPSRAINLLGWRPLYTLDKTLEVTVKWYKIFYNEGKIISEEQLEDYFKVSRVIQK